MEDGLSRGRVVSLTFVPFFVISFKCRDRISVAFFAGQTGDIYPVSTVYYIFRFSLSS